MRDPADLWLTLIGLIFLGRCIKKKNWGWASQLWFKSALALWLFGYFQQLQAQTRFLHFNKVCLDKISIIRSSCSSLACKDRDIRIMMFLSMLIGMLTMCAILIAETLIEPKRRLSWPYGDLVPGGYIAKVSLPVFCVNGYNCK